MKVILASASLRRKEILEMLGIDFSVVIADTDENCDCKDPAKLVETLSYRKAKAVAEKFDKDTLVIGSDTVVFVNGEILGKPKDKADADRMLHLLSGKTHKVLTGVTLLYNGQVRTAHCVTEVTFQQMSESEMEDYISGNEPYDKAGAYAVQGLAARYISGINGCYWNVVGFPVNLFFNMLKDLSLNNI